MYVCLCPKFSRYHTVHDEPFIFIFASNLDFHVVFLRQLTFIVIFDCIYIFRVVNALTQSHRKFGNISMEREKDTISYAKSTTRRREKKYRYEKKNWYICVCIHSFRPPHREKHCSQYVLRCALRIHVQMQAGE